MDEVIGVTNGYGCGNRRKSGTVGYLLNQSSDKPSTTGEALLRRQLRFLVASFWRLASQVGGLVSNKLPSASVKSLSKKNRPEWWGRRPSLLQWKGGNRRFTAVPLQLPFAQGTSSENNVGNRVRTFRCYAL
ncbi:conserved hypothetical protein [Ricinus communis]|uniref:Uncharacterized protein n=1 Tax=Ricinus communis TaxID=3988 RepID=B9STB7_RICCO|nr:conserved hypothetical protein [Ricinus communis]